MSFLVYSLNFFRKQVAYLEFFKNKNLQHVIARGSNSYIYVKKVRVCIFVFAF
jgi:hypothetical protein